MSKIKAKYFKSSHKTNIHVTTLMDLNNHMLIMVGCHYNAVQYIKILCMIWQCQWQNTNQTLNPQKTPHICPSQASYGVSIVRMGRKLTTLQRHHTAWCSGEGIQFTTIIEVKFCSDKCLTFTITSDILQTQFSNVFFYIYMQIKISQKFVLYNACIYIYRWVSGKLWHLQHNGIGDTIVYH